MYERESIKRRALPLLAREVNRAFRCLNYVHETFADRAGDEASPPRPTALTSQLHSAPGTGRIDSETSDFAARSSGD